MPVFQGGNPREMCNAWKIPSGRDAELIYPEEISPRGRSHGMDWTMALSESRGPYAPE